MEYWKSAHEKLCKYHYFPYLIFADMNDFAMTCSLYINDL